MGFQESVTVIIQTKVQGGITSGTKGWLAGSHNREEFSWMETNVLQGFEI
jgi:hypothetical protein